MFGMVRLMTGRTREIVPAVLHDVLARAGQANGNKSPASVVLFDLDSTLLDNRPRQARILREFGQSAGIVHLSDCRPEYFDDWSLSNPMRKCGLSQEEALALEPAARQFWRERFFTSEYCIDDRPISGAVDYVKRVLSSGATVIYCTGRHLDMRAGTLACFAREGFPLPAENDQANGVHLIMKPTFEVHDDEWKRLARDQIVALGSVIAAFDNEPAHINIYREHFPDALCVHLATDDSQRPVVIHPSIRSVLNFNLA